MATRIKRDLVLTQKTVNARRTSTDPKNKVSMIPQMSPEARRAMGLVREDAKENLSSPAFRSDSYGAIVMTDPASGANMDRINNNDNIDGNALLPVNRSRQRPISASNRVHRLPPRHTSTRSTVSKSTVNNPARSRSTLSQPDPPCSTSDNQTTTASSASVYTNNNSNRVGRAAVHRGAGLDDDDEDDDVVDEEGDYIGPFPVEQDFANGNSMPAKEKSFVLALDRALEKNAVSRLKGDITDSARIHQPGTVRALDGGRLANAQEVVVNVCHDDQRQLVFHDDDEESLDTAKEISQIRVNIWMEYNSAFPPDNDIHDFQIPVEAEEVSPSQRRPSSGISSRHATERSSSTVRKNVGVAEGRAQGTRDRAMAARDNENANRNTAASTSRISSNSIPKSAKSGSSGSSRGPSQRGVSLTRRTPSNSRLRR